MNESGLNIDKNKVASSPGKKRENEVVKNILNMIDSPTLLTGMSHEMRTHMNAIVAFSFLMNNTGYNEKEKKEFSIHILNSCEQLLYLFDNFLDSAIIDSGKPMTEMRKFKLSKVLDELLSEFREILNREEHKEVVLIVENQQSDLSEVFIDSEMAKRAIRCLFQNSLINTKSGYIKIGYYFRDSDLVFYILDSGQGYLKCKEFLQTDNIDDSLTKHNDTCSALNLTLAKKIIKLMNGNIWVESDETTGTRMYFSVPVKQACDSGEISDKYFNSRIAI